MPLLMGDFVEDELEGSDGAAVVSHTAPISMGIDYQPRPPAAATAPSSGAWATFASAFLSAVGGAYRPATSAQAGAQAAAAAAAANRQTLFALVGVAGAVALGALLLTRGL
jgi:hypothetical protein